MKKNLLLIMVFFTIVTYSQKKKNGTIYIEHPAINTVESFNRAFIEGNKNEVASYLADDYKFWNGTNSNKGAKAGTKEGALKNVDWWSKNIDYLSMERSPNAYPDAIEYKDSDNKDVVWVQTWEHIKGMHKETGVRIDMPVHRLYVVNKNNKIQTIIDYSDRTVWQELRQSFSDRENGTIYNHHDYINKVRRMMGALENGDIESFYSYFDEKATFRNIHMPVGESMTLAEDKEGMKKMMEEFEITSIDVQGYPDYLNYSLGNAKVVQSWWNLRMVRKSDKKKIVLPLMLIHDFNDDGKITRDNAYYSRTVMNAK